MTQSMDRPGRIGVEGSRSAVDSPAFLRQYGPGATCGIIWGLVILLFSSTPVFAQDEGSSLRRIQELANAALAAHYPDDAHRLQARVKRVEGAIDDVENLRVEFSAAERLPRGTTQVKLYAGSEEQEWQKAGWALLYIARFDSVVVAHTALRTGEEVTTADVGVAWVETTNMQGTLMTPAAWRLLAQQGVVYAARSVGEGRLLRRDALRGDYAAETGDTVMMHFERGGLSVSLMCKARQKGHVDDEIRLYSTDTGKMYRARLTGLGIAQWIETL